MRKVFVVLLALSVSSLIISCSDDDTTVTPTPEELAVTSTVLTQGYTCTPYNFTLEATGGTAPYTWSLALGSTLPDGVSLSADGKITGMLETVEEHAFSVVCTDAADTPHTDTAELTLNIDVPSNPSLAIFFDEDATVCGAETMAFSALDCHVFIMLEDSEVDCATATEFMINMFDSEGIALGMGTQYTHTYVSFPSYVSLSMGDPFSGIAISFNRDMFSAFEGPIHVASYGLLLLENLDNISFQILANPDAGSDHPIIAGCDANKSIIEVDGRSAAINYPTAD
ncbi:MAG: hypothetical protein JW814_01255 [Candidatus Krumholzibacteriota bacterium]|nr:hypothetical protein [Candidatus Krumholzibacteriota bacterium]